MGPMVRLARRGRDAAGTALILLAAATPSLTAQNTSAVQDTARPQVALPPVVDPASATADTAARPGVLAPGGPTDPNELAAWLDGFMEASLEKDDVAGATVAVVKDGQLFYSKGYGYADVANRREVDAARTLFRIGSVSKLFVWTSVMQLVERNLLELDADVNAYLEDLEIPDAYDRPITLEDILTHSGGFEDHVIGLFGDGPEDLRPLGQILAEELPDRVRPPGEVSSYSNHATGLAMHIVETVSGTPWEQYIQENILEPLGMEHFTFSQPVPDALADDLSLGYVWSGGNFVEQGFEYVPLGPVGAASASAEAMARFMIAHLQLGELEGRRILEESTALEMQTVLFRHAPGVNAMLHGFADLSRNGEWIIGHGGDTFWFHSELGIFPDRNLGIFVSTNSGGGNAVAVVDAFVDRYFPEDPDAAVPTPPEDFAERSAPYTGRYRANRFSRTDATKLAALAGGISVRADEDGTLRMSTSGDDRWIEVAPLTFQNEHEGSVVAFREAEDGRMSHLFMGGVPYLALERVPVLESPTLHLWLAVVAVVLFLSTLVLWPLVGFYRFRFGAEPPDPRLPGNARFFSWMASLLLLASLVGIAVAVSDANQIALGHTGLLALVLWIPVVGGIFGIGAFLYALYAWYDRLGTGVGRVAFTLVSVAFLTFLWQFWTFNLFPWTL